MKSTLKLTSVTPFGKEQDKKLNIIVNYLYDNNEAFQFREPVDWKGLELFDYPNIIKHRIDLGTIKNKLSSRVYTTVEEVLDDIQLVWDNCKQYNKTGWFYNLADKLQRSFKKMVRNYLPNIQIMVPSKTFNPTPTQQTQRQSNIREPQIKNYQQPPPAPQSNDEQEVDEIPQSQKIRFHQRLKKLTQQELQKIVIIIQDNCNEAFKQLDKSRSQILMDSLDSQTFKKLNEKVDQFLEGEEKISKKVKV